MLSYNNIYQLRTVSPVFLHFMKAIHCLSPKAMLFSWYLAEIPQRPMIGSGISSDVGPLDTHTWKHKACDIFPHCILRNTGSNTDQQVGRTIFWGGMDWMIFPDVWKLHLFSNEDDLLLATCQRRRNCKRGELH